VIGLDENIVELLGSLMSKGFLQDQRAQPEPQWLGSIGVAAKP
jgi:hypothetical protein